MTRISSGEDIDSVLTSAGAAAVDLLTTRTASPVIARVFRIERDTMVVASEHGAAAGAPSGESIPLSADPLIEAAVTGDQPLAEAGSSPRRIACPIHAGATIHAVLLVERRRSFRDAEVSLVEGVGGIATLAITNLVRTRSVPAPAPTRWTP